MQLNIFRYVGQPESEEMGRFYVGCRCRFGEHSFDLYFSKFIIDYNSSNY